MGRRRGSVEYDVHVVCCARSLGQPLAPVRSEQGAIDCSHGAVAALGEVSACVEVGPPRAAPLCVVWDVGVADRSDRRARGCGGPSSETRPWPSGLRCRAQDRRLSTPGRPAGGSVIAATSCRAGDISDGLPVIGKHPRTRHGLCDATSDLEQITTWWRRWPHANVGIATGTPSGLAIIDVDPNRGGEASLRRLNREHLLPRTAQAGSGTGRHLYFTSSSPVPSSIGRLGPGRLGPGLDVRGDGSFIVAPPSCQAFGRNYRWIILV